jgi:hypothetical protein
MKVWIALFNVKYTIKINSIFRAIKSSSEYRQKYTNSPDDA